MPEVKNPGYSFVVRYLKENPGETQEEIVKAYLKVPGAVAEDVVKVLEELKSKNVLKFDTRGGIRFLQILGPIPKRKAGFWVAEAPPITAVPDRFQYANVKEIAPRDQGDRGTCVGQGCVHAKDALYYNLTKDLPTPEDKALYKKDVVEANKVIHDILYPQSGSAECVYQRSRQIGNVTYPEGSYTYCGLKAMSTNGSTKYNCGVAFEDEWNTSKTPKAVYYPNPPASTIDAAYKSMATHQIDGYAQVSASFDGAKAAIYGAGGICVGSILIYENYNQIAGTDGTFPDPKGSVVGAHCMFFYGYDENYLYVLHSWGDWCGRYGKISRTYVEKGGLTELFKPLDAAEAARYADLYVHIDFTANTPCNFYIDGNYLGTYDGVNMPSGQFKKGVEITVDAEALNYYNTHVIEKYTPTEAGVFAVKFDVALNPVPTLLAINPTQVIVGAPAFTLTVSGANFVVASKVKWDGSDRDTTYVKSTQLSVAIPASDVAVEGAATVTVFNPTPGGGTSSGKVLKIVQEKPWYIRLIEWIISLLQPQ